MRSYKTRLDSIEKRIPRNVDVVCLFSREDYEQVYEDAACTIPVADDSEVWAENKYRVVVRFHTVNGGKK